jgi:hypothetical protein
MSSDLGTAFLVRVQTIAAIGKEANEKGDKATPEERAIISSRIERLYFEIGSLVMANLHVIVTSLSLSMMIRYNLGQTMPTDADVAKQIEALNSFDLSKN